MGAPRFDPGSGTGVAVGVPHRAVPLADGAARPRHPHLLQSPCARGAAPGRHRARHRGRHGRGITAAPSAMRADHGLDSSAGLLAEFRRQARRIGAPARTMRGRVAGDREANATGRCGRVQPRRVQRRRLGPSSIALTSHARHRVVMELTVRHPTAWMADLWLRFHGLNRPIRPDAERRRVSCCADSVCPFTCTASVQTPRHRRIRTSRGCGGLDPAPSLSRRVRDAEVAAALGDRLREDGVLVGAGAGTSRS